MHSFPARALTVAPVSESFYERIDEHEFRSTIWTRGPWGPGSQHGGPPSALLAREIEAVHGRDDLVVARIVLDILRPVPIEPLRASARVTRPGRSVVLVEGALETGEGAVMRASAWLIRTQDTAVGATPSDAAPPAPAEAHEVPVFPTDYEGYLQAMEWRFVSGAFLEPGPATAWLRMRKTLVDGEEPSPLARVLAAADSASGISAALDFGSWVFVNPDLGVYLSRMPTGEWICLEAETTIDERGVGLASSRIHDERGAIGRGQQSLYVSPAS